MNNTLKSITILSFDTAPAGPKALADALAVNKSLTSFDFVGDEQAEICAYFAQKVPANTHLRKFAGPGAREPAVLETLARNSQ